MKQTCRRTRRLAQAWALAFVAGTAATAWSATDFEPEDVQVCPYESDIADPEFEPGGNRMVFMDALGRVRVATMLDDGTVDSPGCAGEVVDTGSTWALPDLKLRQGPEWGLSRRGSEIFHTKVLPEDRTALARVWHDGTAWQSELLGKGEDRGLQIPSHDASDPQSRMIYLRRLSNGRYLPYWRETTKPRTESLLKVSGNADSGGAPRWVPGMRAVSTSVQDADGVFQAALVNIDDRSVRMLTTGPGRKDEVWLWRAPEFDGDWAMISVVDGCCLKVYREVDGQFTEVNSYDVQALSGRDKVFSPEPMVVGDRSYIAFVAGNAKVDRKSQIWVAAADPTTPLARQVSDPAIDAVRAEPEWLITATGVYVYFSQVTSERRSALHRAATGLPVPAR